MKVTHWLVLISLPLSGCGIALRDPALSDGQSGTARLLTNGKKIAEESHTPTVQIANLHKGGRSKSLCTATFVSPRTIITAAHCVDQGPEVVIEKGMPGIKGKRSKTIHTHPNYNGRNGGGDLALVVFDEALPVTFYPVSLAPQPIVVNQPLVLIGYGKTNDRNNNSGGYKQVGWNSISSLGAISYNFSVGGVTSGTGTGEQASLSNGDSGGPACLYSGDRGSDKGLKVAGIASTKNVGLSRGMHIGNYTNLSHAIHSDWLKQMGSQGVSIAGINLGLEPVPPSPPARNETEGSKYVLYLYRHVLGREPSAEEVAYHTRGWMNGAERCAVSSAFLFSDEKARIIVSQWFTHYFRLPDFQNSSPEGFAFWVQALQAGGTRNVLSSLLSSQGFERYTADSMPSPIAAERFVQALHDRILGISPSSPNTSYDVAFGALRLTWGQVTKDSFVGETLYRDEHVSRRINEWHRQYFARDVADWRPWADTYRAQSDERAVENGVACSDEAFAHSKR